ncbi:hypothetical protein [Nitrosopumilus ureiphilus]|uniref:Uncharacterized protein n=1 Tax=Nitrosopumilus ureiphilus TaxID=1470067 RepID=A0A7D5R7M4_9ARCH|nr:hypothetical protein [Nitrosopumilus ureiphilus]QLH07677.1 hypothetical protein C5F50_11795 [Nitrosopumilus ureiphilus]
MSSEINPDYVKLVLEKRQRLRLVHEKYFPGKFWVLDSCLAVRNILQIEDISLPFMLVLLGQPSAGKSTMISFVDFPEDCYSVDSFTPKAMVSHMANKTEDQLAQIDMLSKIADKVFLTSDLAPIFSVREDNLLEIIGMLTRILDGKGYKKDSGAHSQRKYDDVFFVWIGAVVEVPRKVWPIIASLGPKIYFLRIDTEISFEEEQEKILENLEGISYEQKVTEIKQAVKEYLDVLKEFPGMENGKIPWNKSKEDKRIMVRLVQYSQLLARLRGHVPVEYTKGQGGANYGFLPPIIEDANRATVALYNLAKGQAVNCARNYITEDDLPTVKKVVLSSAPKERVELLKLLVENNGELTSTKFMEVKKVTRMTALKTMKQLEILDLVDEVKISTVTKPCTAIRLKEHFMWLVEEGIQ